MNPIIDRDTIPSGALDYAFFRQKGMELIQKLSGRQWTDHNIHDPGITVLEQLCYALTDLSYRIDFSVSDLMTDNENEELTDNFKPGAMLTTGPVNLQDWRKLLIDTDGVRNAWIYPLDTTSSEYDSRVYFDPVEEALRMNIPTINRDSKRSLEPIDMLGLYKVVFVPEPKANREVVKKTLHKRLNERRNLCEDFHQISSVAMQGVKVEGHIEIGEVGDPAALLARIYFAIQNYLSPRIKFYTLQERLEEGHILEDILDGPVLDHGFLDDDELNAFQVRNSIRISDLIKVIIDIEGVRAVQGLTISLPDSNSFASTKEGEPWELLIPDDHFPELLIPVLPSKDRIPDVGINLIKQGLTLRIDWAKSRRWLSTFNKEEINRTHPLLQDNTFGVGVEGRNREVNLHQSIQHQFPEVYGIGLTGVPRPASPTRIAQARQFKSYLAIFDQLLANAFGQLGGTSKLFSLKKGGTQNVYFSETMLNETPGLRSLIDWRNLRKNTATSDQQLYDDYVQQLTEGGNPEPSQDQLNERKNRLLNHLLARFGEEINEHDVVLENKLVSHKEAFLNDYALLSHQRGKAFDYTANDNSGERANVSGLERRLALMLGFSLPSSQLLKNLSKTAPGSFYMMEHILLRPGLKDLDQRNSLLKLQFTNNDKQPPLKDPFSLQLSFIFPKWLDRFDNNQNPGFQEAVIKTIREETPAHIRIYVQWLDQSEMAVFEDTYHNWIEQLKAK